MCRRIKALLNGQLEPVPDSVEEQARRIALLVSARRAQTVERGASARPPRKWHHVDVHSLKTIRPRTVGAEHVGLWAMEEFGLPKLPENLGMTPGMRPRAPS